MFRRPRLRASLIGLAVAISVASCTPISTQPVATPATTQQSIAYGYAQLAGAYGLLGDLVERGRISGAEGRQILGQLDALRATMDAASAAGNAQGVASVTQGLIAIEQDLKARASR